MRPHRLRVTAFGAFGGTAEVCFDDLAASGLFLLHGETGAGKTTLLDAIGFALYGRVPGERGKARRLRSDHAAADVATEVELEATVGGRRLRITRRPEQARPKRRGDGFTTEQARVLLAELSGDGLSGDGLSGDGSWRTVSTRVGEADTEIADLMGMSAEQFFQVVLLPQGQFAQFLHSDAEGRGKLLQRLFGTDRFRAVEDWLAAKRRELADSVAAQTQHVDQLVARIQDASAQEILAGPGAMAPETVSAAWAIRLAEAAAGAATEAAGRVSGCRASLDAALERKAEAERLAGRQRRRADALLRRQELAAAEPRVAEGRRTLEAANRAAEVAPALTAAEQAAAELTSARASEQRARAAISGMTRSAEPDAAELRQAAQQHLQQLGHLEALRSLADQAAEEDMLAITARKDAAALDAELTALRERRDSKSKQHDELSMARDTARDAAAELPGVRSEAERCRRAADDGAALAKAYDQGKLAHSEHLRARETAVGHREEASRLREARIDGMRAELAATLTDGAPCPVCGSPDHPELCELRGEQVTREQEAAATAAAEAAVAAAEAIGTRVASARARIADLTARLAAAGFTVLPDATAPELAATARELEVTARGLEARAARLDNSARMLTGLQAESDKLAREIADAVTRLAELAQQGTAELDKAGVAERRAADHRVTLASQLGGALDLEAALAAERTAAETLAGAADAADATARAREAARRAGDTAQQAADGAGFGDVAAASAAQRDQAWRARADKSVREHEASAAAVAGLLEDPDLDVALEPPADIRGSAEAAACATTAHEDAVAAQARAQRTADQLAILAPELAAKLAELEPLAERAAEARKLADLAAGQGANTLRMTLSSFVLAARLEEVAAAASQRLLAMTAGRYSLVHSDARRGGGGRSGLGLLACDAWTGADRDTSTLSGGETFMASLALALGLADVVTEEAGGTRIEALFVDEGFGSLDEETLEEVMNVLDGLREGGRCVGVVSHVAELRQRIPAQIRVRKSHTGSTVSVGADAR
jgi:DNA repair protein SbcC/Rad50